MFGRDSHRWKVDRQQTSNISLDRTILFTHVKLSRGEKRTDIVLCFPGISTVIFLNFNYTRLVILRVYNVSPLFFALSSNN